MHEWNHYINSKSGATADEARRQSNEFLNWHNGHIAALIKK